MNCLKNTTSKISSETLLNTRRSSLPSQIFDEETSDVNLSDVRKKHTLFSFSNTQLNKESINIPRIILERRKSTHNSSSTKSYFSSENQSPYLRENLLSPFSPFPFTPKHNDWESLYHSKPAKNFEILFKTNRIMRRVSCGPIITYKSSPGIRLSLISKNVAKHLSVYSKSASPRLLVGSKSPQYDDIQSCKRKESLNDSPLSRNHSYLHFPSLSPCFEDKPKLNHFGFSKISTGDNIQLPNQRGLLSESKIRGNQRNRRASVHGFLPASPCFSHNGLLSSPNFNLRRNSFDPSNISISELSDDNNNISLELGKGNKKLLAHSNFPKVDFVMGKGGFGVVKVGQWKGERVAIKVMKGRKAISSIGNERNSLKLESNFNLVLTKAIVYPLDELNIAIETPSPHGVNKQIIPKSFKYLKDIFGVSYTPKNVNPEDASYWALVVSELCTPNNILNLINSNLNIKIIDKLRILRQIASALNHMHRLGFAHLDVKPANCFLTPTGVVKLGDFGCTTRIGEIPKQVLGTVAYQAPEALKGDTVSAKCDIYSLGITAWHLATSEMPYTGFHPHVIIYKVTRMNHRPETTADQIQTLVNTKNQNLNKKSNAYNNPNSNSKSFAETGLFSLIRRCWSPEPCSRPSTESFIRTISALAFSI